MPCAKGEAKAPKELKGVHIFVDAASLILGRCITMFDVSFDLVLDVLS
jgi:hypothetical protein